MKNLRYSIGLLLLFFSISSCAVVGGIFKAGVWVGALLIIAVVALVIFIINKSSSK
jgi:hypothetical protein